MRADRGEGVAGRAVRPHVPGAVGQALHDVADRLAGLRTLVGQVGAEQVAVHPGGEPAATA